MCPEIRNEIQVKGNMKDIYDDDIKEDIIETITNIMELRKQKLGSKWKRIGKLKEKLKPIQAQVTLCAQVTEHICAARIFDDFAMAPMFLLQLLSVPWIGLKLPQPNQQNNLKQLGWCGSIIGKKNHHHHHHHVRCHYI